MVGLYLGETPIGKVNVGTFSENGFDTSTATMTENDLLLGKTGFNATGKITGNIPSANGGTYTQNQTVQTAGKYMTGDIVIDVPQTGITPSGTVPITENGTHDVRNYAYAEVNVPTRDEPVLQTKTVNPTTSTQVVSPDSGYDALRAVQVNPIQTETKTVTENGSYTPTAGKFFSRVDVNVPTGEITPPVLQEKTVNPTTAQQVITPNSGYDGLSKVTVQPVTASIDADIVPSNIKEGVNILGVTGTYKPAETPTPVMQSKTVSPTTSQQTVTPDSGYDGLSSVTVNAMPTGALNAPTVGANGLVTANIGTSGYLPAGTQKTLQLPVKGASTITPKETAQTIAAGQYLTGAQTIAAIPSDYIGSAVKVQNYYTGSTVPSNTLGADGDLYLRL